MTLPDGSTLPIAGKLDFVSPSLDAATGTQEFRALFRNPDRLLLPGQFVQVRLEGPQPGIEQRGQLARSGEAVLTRHPHRVSSETCQ